MDALSACCAIGIRSVPSCRKTGKTPAALRSVGCRPAGALSGGASGLDDVVEDAPRLDGFFLNKSLA